MNKVVELVNQWAKYEALNPDLDLKSFCIQYLSEQQTTETNQWQLSLDSQLSGLLGRMSGYANMYAKKALTELEFNNTEEWVYMRVLMYLGTPKKSELIYQMLSEFPSGIDIIKRLIHKNYVEEFPDEQDKRSKRVKLTKEGYQVLTTSLPQMEKVGQMAFGSLSETEKNMLAHLLSRLETFHDYHQKAIRNATFEESYMMLTKS